MRIGSIELQKPLALAPMEDVTDYSFRTICKELGADLLYTEFASSEALMRDVDKPSEIPYMRTPIAVQISDAELYGRAAAVVTGQP